MATPQSSTSSSGTVWRSRWLVQSMACAVDGLSIFERSLHEPAVHKLPKKRENGHRFSIPFSTMTCRFIGNSCTPPEACLSTMKGLSLSGRLLQIKTSRHIFHGVQYIHRHPAREGIPFAEHKFDCNMWGAVFVGARKHRVHRVGHDELHLHRASSGFTWDHACHHNTSAAHLECIYIFACL